MPKQVSSERRKKRVGKDVCAAAFPYFGARLPAVDVLVDGKFRARSLLDTGCSKSIISSKFPFCAVRKGSSREIVMMNGDVAQCSDSVDVEIRIGTRSSVLNCLVTNTLPGFDMLLGMDVVSQLGGVRVCVDGSVRFGSDCEVAASAICLNDKDYRIRFSDGFWSARWTWADGSQEPTLMNQVPNYRMSEDVTPQFESVVESWIEKGWLRPFDGVCEGIIPLLAVVQQNKNKVRPVLDYRELNSFVSSHTAESEVCGEKLRCWRRMGSNLCLLDLRDAYLQVHVDEDLWRYQVVVFRGKRYCLTRLGFGLNAAPKIMSAIVQKVLSICPRIAQNTDSFVDDIIVNLNEVSAEEVRQHLKRYGLECKEPVPLSNARVLGLRVRENDEGYFWERDNPLPDVPKDMTRRQLFSICGQLTSHYPIAGWLRPACSLLKRFSNSGGWDEAVSDSICQKTEEIMGRIRSRDPVHGKWDVPRTEAGAVWCDASSIAIGVAVEVGGHVVEDNSWLRKEDDCSHINLAELEAVVKGINAAVSWGLRQFVIHTDSATVHAWLRSVVEGDRKARTHGLSEVLVKRRLGLIKGLLEECELSVEIKLVSSSSNKADCLTRVPQKWLRREPESSCVSTSVEDIIAAEHSIHHFGVDRTLYLVNCSFPDLKVSRASVDRVIKMCMQCARIDPAPVRWEHGELSVDHCWERLAADVTHYDGCPFLTFVDCGPGRFTVWKQLANEGSGEVCSKLEDLCREHGSPKELLLDNALSFKSQQFTAVCQKWGIQARYRCAYRASGNGIVERIHRTIKRMAARSGGSVLDMTYWYNVSPKDRTFPLSVPSKSLYTYDWRIPHATVCTTDRSLDVDRPEPMFWVGQRVFVKPGQNSCTAVWPEGRVTRSENGLQLDVDGVPRHVADVRPVPGEEAEIQPAPLRSEHAVEYGSPEGANDTDSLTRYPVRRRAPPDRFGDPLIDEV